MSLKSSIKYKSCCLLVLLALFGVVFQSVQAQDCTKKYHTINTFESLTSFNVTCYSTDADCELYFVGYRQSCTSNAPRYGGQIPANETKLITYDNILKPGDGICSNHQISVQVTRPSGKIVQLPRASDAGKNFHLIFQTLNVSTQYRISTMSLAKHTEVDYRFNYDISRSTLRTSFIPYIIDQGYIEIFPGKYEFNELVIEADESIVVSIEDITRNNGNNLVLQPVSNGPIVVYAKDPHSYFTMSVVDCITNEKHSDASHVSVEFSTLNGDECGQSLQPNTMFGYHLYLPCLITVTPLDKTTCVATNVQGNDNEVTSMGLPKSKLSTRLGSQVAETYPHAISFSNESCYAGQGDDLQEIALNWIPGNLYGKIAEADVSRSANPNSWFSCPSAAYFMLVGSTTAAINFGHETEENWWPYFVDLECGDPPTVDCSAKYYTINTIKRLSKFNVTCYSTDLDCEIFLVANGQGCTGGGLVSGGRLVANQTIEISTTLDLGGGICSTEQISVQVMNRRTGEVIQLPRASDAGTKFFVNLQTLDVPYAGYKISLQTLAEGATISYRFHPDNPISSQTLGPYQFMNDLANGVREFTNFNFEIESTAPIVVSMKDFRRTRRGVYQVLQPVSSEPVVVYNQNYDSYFSMAVVDCDTNQLQPDTSRVKLRFSGLHGHNCFTKVRSDSPFSYSLATGCLVTVTPLDDNTCVSTYAQNRDSIVTSVGMPKSKLSTRLGSQVSDTFPIIISFSNESCHGGVYGWMYEEFELDWVQGAHTKQIARFDYFHPISTYFWLECPSSAFFLFLNNYKKATMYLGYESEANWKQFFEAEKCANLP